MEYIDFEKNSWINEIPESEKKNVINRVLKLGHMVLSLSQVSINPMNTLFDPLKNQMDLFILENKNNMEQIGGKIKDNITEIRSSVDYLTRSKHTSVIKGTIGEITIEKIIKDGFPDDNIINMSKSAGESDYHFMFDNFTILIEVKTYSNNVPTSEIKKFKRDLSRTGIDMGIFISTTSGITGHKRFEIEDGDKQIIYVPNSGLDGSSIIWSIILCKKLIGLKKRENKIEKKNYEEYFLNFENEYTNICKLRYDIQKGKSSIEQIFENLYLQTINIEIKLKTLIEDASQKLRIEYSEEFKYNDRDKYIQLLSSNKNKNLNIITKLLDVLDNKNLEYRFNSDFSKWKIYKNNSEMGIVKVKKSKVDFEMYSPHIIIDCDDSGLKLIYTII